MLILRFGSGPTKRSGKSSSICWTTLSTLPDSGGKVTVDAEVRNGVVLVTLSDTGIGIPPPICPYFRAVLSRDRARSRQMGGTGLGLSIVRHIVEKVGGTIHAESELGKGTRMILRCSMRRRKVRSPRLSRDALRRSAQTCCAPSACAVGRGKPPQAKFAILKLNGLTDKTRRGRYLCV